MTTDLGQAYPGSPFGDMSVASAEPLRLLSAAWSGPLRNGDCAIMDIGEAFKKVELTSVRNDVGYG